MNNFAVTLGMVEILLTFKLVLFTGFGNFVAALEQVNKDSAFCRGHLHTAHYAYGILKDCLAQNNVKLALGAGLLCSSAKTSAICVVGTKSVAFHFLFTHVALKTMTHVTADHLLHFREQFFFFSHFFHLQGYTIYTFNNKQAVRPQH